MKKLIYSVDIKASVVVVYRSMLGFDNIETYESWTRLFNPTSTYKGNWEKGSMVRFIGTNEEGNQGGMMSEVVEHIPNEFVSLRHHGVLLGDQIITEGPEIQKWAGGHENYRFEQNGNVTTVTVETDTHPDFWSYFNELWPKGLAKLKEIAENFEM